MWAYSTARPWQTIIFTSLAFLQLGHAMAVRSERESLRTLGLLSSIPLLASVVGTVLLQLAVVYWSPLQAMFRTEGLTLGDLAIVLTGSTTVFWAVEIEKWVRRRNLGGGGDPRAQLAVSLPSTR